MPDNRYTLNFHPNTELPGYPSVIRNPCIIDMLSRVFRAHEVAGVLICQYTFTTNFA